MRRIAEVAALAVAAVALSGCRREEAAPASAAPNELVARPFFPRLRDMVIVKIDPPADAGDANGDADEPAGDLFIDRFEATDGEFQAFRAATGYRPRDTLLYLDHWLRGSDGEPATPREQDTPVRWVSLEDALSYAHVCGKELPTRAEWLGACPSIASGLLPWSGRVRAGACNSPSSRLEAPTPVGMYQLGMTPSGCYDMVGNVAEWTTTIASGPEKRCVMGGSFAYGCDPDNKGRAGEGRTPGAAFARSAEEREALMEPWMERNHPDERRGDVGFRCIVRDAAKVVAEALVAVDAMGDAQRPLALAELARTGVSPSGENRLTPFVRDFLLARRRRFALAADGRRRAADGRQIDPLRIARCDVTRVDSAHGPGDDLLLTGDDRVTLLDGRDGSIAFQTEVPGCGSHPRHGMVVGRDGTRRAWVEGGNGAIALVDWRGGRSDSVAALGGGRAIAPEPTTWCASAPDLRGDPWFVQAYEVVDSVAGGLRPCTRVVRVRADGVHERVLTGSPLVAPARANDEGLFLPLEQRIEAALPVGRRTGRMREDLWHLCALDVGADLATRGTTWVSEVRVALALPSSVRARQLFGDGELRFFWIVGAGETCLDAPSGSGPWLFPTELAATYFLRDGSGRLFVWSCDKEGAPLLQPLPPPPQGDWRVVPAEDDWVEPLLLSGDGGELREVAPAAVTLRARDLAWSGDLVFGALVRAPGRPLIVRTRAGDWFGVALDEPSRRFKRNLARATIGEQVTQLPGGAIAISAQATPFEAWVRDGERFELLDDAGVVRPPIEQFVVADLGGTGRFDPVLRFSDGSLVALRPPDPRMARLAEEWSLAVRGAATAADR